MLQSPCVTITHSLLYTISVLEYFRKFVMETFFASDTAYPVSQYKYAVHTSSTRSLAMSKRVLYSRFATQLCAVLEARAQVNHLESQA